MTSKAKYSLLILIIFHCVGVYLFVFKPELANLSYITLILTGILLLLNEKSIQTILIPISITLLGGFLIELVGTKTGLLFGEYEYGDALGMKLFGVPLVIGVNWMVIVRSSVSFSSSILKAHKIIIAIFSGLICTLIDFLIEPIAIIYDFWSWEGDSIPIYNYISWFIFSSLFSYIYLQYKSKKNILANSILIIWIAFFAILNLL